MGKNWVIRESGSPSKIINLNKCCSYKLQIRSLDLSKISPASFEIWINKIKSIYIIIKTIVITTITKLRFTKKKKSKTRQTNNASIWNLKKKPTWNKITKTNSAKFRFSTKIVFLLCILKVGRSILLKVFLVVASFIHVSLLSKSWIRFVHRVYRILPIVHCSVQLNSPFVR